MCILVFDYLVYSVNDRAVVDALTHAVPTVLNLCRYEVRPGRLVQSKRLMLHEQRGQQNRRVWKEWKHV